MNDKPEIVCWQTRFRPRPWMLLLLPLLLYAAALNPYFPPGSYDEVLYYAGAASLAEDGTFKFREQYISDWPPGFSLLMAVPFCLMGPSVWLAKICVLLCAALGLILALQLFQKERRPFPLLTLGLFALLPFSFSMGTRILSEWPYFVASMLFLHALHSMEDARGLRVAVLAGLLLGLAALTKFTGVLLGAAIIAQALARWRSTQSRRWIAILPEAVTAAIGAGLFLAWKAKIHWQIAVGTAAPYEYYHSGFAPKHFGGLEPLSIPAAISDLFFRTHAIAQAMDGPQWIVQLAVLIPGILVFVGLAARFSSKDRAPSDWYALTLLIVFACFADNKQTRYLMPIAPFLVNYALIGGQRIGQSLDLLGRRFAIWFARGALGAWALLSIALAGYLLLIGGPDGSYRGLCYFASGTPETFYRGHWLDLYRACQKVRDDPAPGNIAVIGGEDKYVTYFTRRHWIDFNPAAEFVYLLVLNGSELSREQSASLNLRCTRRGIAVVLYRRNTLPASNREGLFDAKLTGTTRISDGNN